MKKDFSEIYTETDLIALYNSLKIRYNPMDYSFKDRLIIESNLIDTTMTYFDFGSEYSLLGAIAEHKGTSYNNVNAVTICGERVEPLASYNSEDVGLVPSVIFKDNLYLDPDVILEGFTNDSEFKALAKDLKLFKKSEILEAILTLCIALKKSNSLIHNLKWLSHSKYSEMSLKVLNDLEFVEPAIEKSNSDLQLFYNNCINTHYTPLSDCFINRYVIRDIANGVDEECFECEETMSAELAKSKIMLGFFESYVFGIEILYALTTIGNLKYQDILKQLFGIYYTKNSAISELYTVKTTPVSTDLEINPKILDIISESNPEVRFEMIKAYIDSRNFKELAEINAKRYLAFKAVGIPYFFGQFLMYAKDLSIQTIRIKTCIKLLDICNKCGIDLTKDSRFSDGSMFESLEALKDMTPSKDSDTPSMSEEKVKKSTSMLSTPNPAKSSGTADSDGVKTVTSPTLEALDRAKASFEDNDYKFSTEDVIDSSDRYSGRYNTIAESVHLINQNLIRRIRDIKVYNEGGKNSGKKVGKLDRKNLYKYKTSKDIFYDNTYKVKESDLAFGIILDVSGSMRGSGIENGRITMIILHETLKALNINHSIITHTTHGGNHTCEIKRYQAFKEDATFSTRKNYALAGITAESGNCDSAALYYMEKALSRVRNKDKICIMFSDGQPTECTSTELKDQIHNMERKGIKVIGVGIDFESIKHYYTDNANGRNLKEMLEIVSNILKEYVLKKED